MKKSSNIEWITPDIAKEYLKLNILNRKMSESHVADLCDKVKNGLFEFNGESIIFSDDNVLLDGQHRLMACVKTGIPFESVVVRGVPRKAISTIDIGRNRSVADLFTMEGIMDSNKVSSMVQSYIRFSKGSVSVFGHTRRMEGLKVSRKDMLEFYYTHKDLITEINLFASQCYRKVRILKHSEIGGLALYLIIDKCHNIDVVKSFFFMLVFNQGVTNDTINTLRDKLINDLASDRKMLSRLKYSLLAKCWNAYITGKVLKVLSWSESKEGFVGFV